MKKTKSLISLSISMCLVWPALLFAGWMHTYGGEYRDKGACVQETSDGGYIVVGSTDWIGDSCSKVWLLKFNASGDTLWTRIYGSGFDNGFCVRQTFDGGYILATSLGLMKTNESGEVQWTKPYPGNSVSVTTDGGYVLISWRNGNPWLLKTDSNGDTLWTREYDWLDELNCVSQTSDGGYALAGRYSVIGLTNQGYWLDCAWFAKTDSLANFLWEIDILGDAMTAGYSTCETGDGGFIFGGVHEWDAATTDYLLLVKTDSAGNSLWQYDHDNNPVENRTVKCVSPTADSGCVVADGEGFHLAKFSSDGDIEWYRRYSGVYELTWGVQTEDGGNIATGYASPNPGDLVLLKTDADGTTGSVEEPPPVKRQPDWQVVSPVGRTITLRYENHPRGFRAAVFDASGRKVDEIYSSQTQGTLQWGGGRGPGVYFIVPYESKGNPAKVVLIR